MEAIETMTEETTATTFIEITPIIREHSRLCSGRVDISTEIIRDLSKGYKDPEGDDEPRLTIEDFATLEQLLDHLDQSLLYSTKTVLRDEWEERIQFGTGTVVVKKELINKLYMGFARDIDNEWVTITWDHDGKAE